MTTFALLSMMLTLALGDGGTKAPYSKTVNHHRHRRSRTSDAATPLASDAPPPPPVAAPPLTAPGWNVSSSMWAGCAEPEPDAVRHGACCPPECGRCGDRSSSCTPHRQECCVRPLVKLLGFYSCDDRRPPCLLARYVNPQSFTNPHSEPALHHVLASLFTFGLVGPGAILDAGANDGAETAFLATLQLERLIIAVEPLAANVAAITKRLLPLLPNVRIVQGGLSSEPGTGSYPARMDRRQPGEYNQIGQNELKTVPTTNRRTFNITTVDALMSSFNVALALAHWDVEGGELNILRGARNVIARDRPIFTVESAPHDRRSAHGELIRFIESLGYEVFEIAEMCGFLDCRNYLCIPPQLKHSFAPHRNAILEGYRPLFP